VVLGAATSLAGDSQPVSVPPGERPSYGGLLGRIPEGHAGLELLQSRMGHVLDFPFRLSELQQLIDELEQ
jgi:hypothetical protein